MSGLLLSGGRAQAPPKRTAASAARTGKLSEEGGGPSLPGAALGLLVTAGLLGFGALAELRGAFIPLYGTKAPWRAL